MDNQVYQAPKSDIEVELDEPRQAFNYRNWQGRLGRLKYLQLTFFIPVMVFFGYLFLSYLLLYLLDSPSNFDMWRKVQNYLTWGVFIIVLVSYVNWIWLSIQRVHDFGASGWLSILVFVPLIHVLLFIVAGEPEKNKFGSPVEENTIMVKITGWLGLVGLAMYYLLLWVLGLVFWT